MKIRRILLILLLGLNFMSLKAYSFSEWSTDYPKEYEDFLIESEVRYKWYKESMVDIQYLTKDEFGDRLYDLNDFKNSEVSNPVIERPESKEGRVIYGSMKNHTFSINDVDHILLSEFIFNDNVYLSEIEVYDKKTNNLINYTLEKQYNNLYNTSFLNNMDKTDYVLVGSPTKVLLKLQRKYSINDLSVKIFYKSIGNENNTYLFSFVHSLTFILSNKNIDIEECVNGCIKTIEYDNTHELFLTQKLPHYSYTDKVYKTYYIENVYDDNYHKELEGYIKDEKSETTFYRYITDEIYYTDVDGNFITEDRMDYCNKSFCFINRVIKEDIPKIDEIIPKVPKTIDNVNNYYIMFSLSIFIIIVTLSIMFYYEKNKTKCRTNKKSSFVEINKIN